jgi:hypothetical protein
MEGARPTAAYSTLEDILRGRIVALGKSRIGKKGKTPHLPGAGPSVTNNVPPPGEVGRITSAHPLQGADRLQPLLCCLPSPPFWLALDDHPWPETTAASN